MPTFRCDGLYWQLAANENTALSNSGCLLRPHASFHCMKSRLSLVFETWSKMKAVVGLSTAMQLERSTIYAPSSLYCPSDSRTEQDLLAVGRGCLKFFDLAVQASTRQNNRQCRKEHLVLLSSDACGELTRHNFAREISNVQRHKEGAMHGIKRFCLSVCFAPFR